MEFKGLSEQTSILILLGLGFVFLLGFSFYFFEKRGPISLWLRLILGLTRASLLLILTVFVVPLYVKDSSLGPGKTRQIMLVDSSPYVQKREVDSVKRVLSENFPNLEVIYLSKSSWGLALDTLYALNQDRLIDHAFLLTDGQLSDLENENNMGVPIHLIAIGPVISKSNLGLYIPVNSIKSVVGELISLPIDLWVKQIQSKEKLNFEIWKGSQLVFQKLIFFDEMSAYQKIEVPLQASKIGTYHLHIRFGKKVASDLIWEVVREKVQVDGFAPWPHPDLGVISRNAAQQFIRINWHFGESVQVKPSMKNLIFYEKRPKDLASLQNHSVWYLGMELPNSFVVNSSSLYRKEVHFWDEQMEAYRNQKSFSKIDSIFNRLFAQTFLRNIQADTLLNKEISNENPASLLGRNEEKLAYLGLKNQVDFSIQRFKKVRLSNEIKSVPIWRHPYVWLVLIILIFVEWGIRKRYL